MKVIKSIILASCLVANFAFLYLAWEISLINLFLAFGIFCLTFVFQGAMHEVGHFIGGSISGYKLVVLQIGRANLIGSRSGDYKLEIKMTKGGQCIMLPPDREPVRYVAYNIGGIIMNLAITIASTILLLFNSNVATLVFLEFLLSGIFKIVSNSVPNMVNGIPTDGYIIKLLKGRPLIQGDYQKYLSLYAKIYWEEDISVDDYVYARKEENTDDLLYYEGINDLLNDIQNKE